MRPENNGKFMKILKTLDNLSVLKFEEKKQLAEMIVELHVAITEEINDLKQEVDNEDHWNSSTSSGAGC